MSDADLDQATEARMGAAYGSAGERSIREMPAMP
jgi:acyl-CoA reductase-like NAD-dependent aldehyde dehydrogenase